MAKTLTEAMLSFSQAIQKFRWTLSGVNVKPRSLRQIWEAKMPVDVFEARMDYRRRNRRRRGDMALIRMIGGILTLFFYLFLIIGAIVTIGILFKFPVIGIFFAACTIAAFIEVFHKRKRKTHE